MVGRRTCGWTRTCDTGVCSAAAAAVGENQTRRRRPRRPNRRRSETAVWAYIVRRILLTIPIVLGVVLITMILFSYVAADPARAWAGRVASEAQLDAIRAEMGLDKPRWFKWSVPVRKV